jgi:DNA oxidative demethylase
MQKIDDGFYYLENYFSPEEEIRIVKSVLELGRDERRGFKHPDLKPNRFHPKPKYPVKKYMCFGLYWNPLTYQYTPTLPESDISPFEIPSWMKHVSDKLIKLYFPEVSSIFKPQSAIINYYTEQSRMGLHTDKEEKDLRVPVIGFNFGATGRFQYINREGKTCDLKVTSGSVYLFGGPMRLMRHGLAHVYKKTAPSYLKTLIHPDERLNLTLRKVY